MDHPDDDLSTATMSRSVQVLTAVSMMAENLLRIRQQRSATQADRDFDAARTMKVQYRSERAAAMAVYGQAGDPTWRHRATVPEAAQVWRAAHDWSTQDPAAAKAQGVAEDVLRRRAPEAMANYDALRAQGVDELAAMRQSAGLFVTGGPDHQVKLQNTEAATTGRTQSSPTPTEAWASAPDELWTASRSSDEANTARAEAGAARSQFSRDMGTPDIKATVVDEHAVAAHDAGSWQGRAAAKDATAASVAAQSYPPSPRGGHWVTTTPEQHAGPEAPSNKPTFRPTR